MSRFAAKESIREEDSNMKKPQLCLALSFSLVLLQANLVPAMAEPASPAIWQKLSGAAEPSAKTVSHFAPKKKASPYLVAKGTSAAKGTFSSYTTYGVATASADGQALLFLSGRHKDASNTMPAAALTIHPSLSNTQAEEVVATASSTEKPTLVAMSEMPAGIAEVVGAQAPSKTVSDATPLVADNSAVASKQLIAQLAPDQLIAQGDQGSEPSAVAIPPVVSGNVDMEEFRPSNVIELRVSQSRTFKLKNKIVRTSISDPSVAEPVVVSENQLVLLGRAPGGATLVIWDDAGNSVAVDLRVARDFSQLQSTLREIDPRIIVKPFSVGGGDRVILLGDVDHAESVIRAFTAANAFMDDRGMNIIAANSRLLAPRIGEQSTQGGGGQQQQQTGQLGSLSSVDRYTYFSNMNNNVGKAQSMVSDGGRVTSLIKVRKNPLIVLHCSFMEMNSAAVRELGVQLGLNFTSQSFGFGIGGNTGTTGLLTTLPGTNGTQGVTTAAPGAPTAIISGAAIPNPNLLAQVAAGTVAVGPLTTTNTVPGVLSYFQTPAITRANTYGATSAPVNFSTPAIVSAIGQGVLNTPASIINQATLFGNPGGAAFTNGGAANPLGNLFTAISNFASGSASRWSINPTIQGIITSSRARILAEPTLVTISGERAAFLAGGEIPIPQAIATAGAALQSIIYEPYGLRLNMIPVLLENGVINLQVSPEERILDAVNGFTQAGSSTIPAFTTRKTQTIVELKPGQELYISGLVTANSGRQLTKTPVVGELPVLGALYRSKAFVKNESELVVSVRPEIIVPGTPGQLKIPEEISRTEATRDMNMMQVEPSVIDERYMTSGASERTQKIPGQGAPLP